MRGPKGYGICPLCEKARARHRLHRHIEAERPEVRREIAKAVRHEFPAWSLKDGACEACWEAYRGVARVQRFVRHLKMGGQP